MPAGAAVAPGAFPRGLAGLSRFPEGEIGGVLFAFAGAAPFALEGFDRAVREFAVVRVFADVEVDVAIGFVGDATIDEAFDEVDDLGHAIGRAGEVVDLVDAERGEVRVVVGDVFFRDVEHRDAAIGCFLDELVVDIGDVDDPIHLVAAVGEVAFDAIEDDGADHVADVGFVVDGWAAEVDADFARFDGGEWFFALGERVVDAQRGVSGGEGQGGGFGLSCGHDLWMSLLLTTEARRARRGRIKKMKNAK